LSEFSEPQFKIQLRRIEEETPSDLKDSRTIENTTLPLCREVLYDLLREGYEAWISNASGDPLTDSTEKYIVDYEAQNVLEDGYPLIIRKLHHSVALLVNQNVEPFGIEAYVFFRGHISRGELLESFGARTVKSFETIIRNEKR